MRRSAIALAAPLVTFVVGVLAASCGGGDGGTIEETDAVTGTSGTSTPDGYPPGPYGADFGETMPNLTWMGFVGGEPGRLATETAYAAYSLDDARRSGKPYALVHFGAVF